MRVVLVTQGISRIVRPVSDFLGTELVAIIESAPRNYQPTNKSLFLRPKHALAQYAQRKFIPYFLLAKKNQAECIFWLKNLSPDLVVVYSVSQLFSPEFLALPSFGCINLHPSLLPMYRGPNPWFWSYYNQDEVAGVTLHYLDPGEDTGPIIDQRSYEVPLGIKSLCMQDLAIGKLGLDMILEALKKFQEGSPVLSLPQPVVSPTERARILKPSEHVDIINWSEWPIERIWHVMCGTELWLNCIEQPSGLMKGLRWQIDDFEKKSSYHADAYLWGKLSRDKIGKYVICRDGLIRIRLNAGIKAIAKTLLKRAFHRLHAS